VFENINIRRYTPGEEPALFEIFYSAIHLVASSDYTSEQIEAWAPRDLDQIRWERKIRAINPFVAELNGVLVGYADIQSSGYIDHFYVSGEHPRRGIGSILMKRLFEEATLLNAHILTSDVSQTAQPFFRKFGFIVVEQRYPECFGVIVPNALMRRGLNEA
jgi:putative acetyltransferase